MTRSYEFIGGDGTVKMAPIKAWIRGVPMDDNTFEQVKKTAQMPFVRGVALMPDAHVGIGSTVGSVIATDSALIPACVGVDIGCVDGDSEYLTVGGWRRIADYDGGMVMQYDPETGVGQLVAPQNYIKVPCEDFYWFHTKYGVNQMLSAEHRVLCWEIRGRDRRREMTVMTAETLAARHCDLVQEAKVEFETTFTPNNLTSLDISHEQIRVHVMVSADGHIEGPSAVITFRKPRKISRCRKLLTDAGILFTENVQGNNDTVFRFRPPSLVKGYKDFWSASVQQLEIIANECFYWDGNHDERCFYTRDRESADFMQYVFTSTGTRGVLREDEHADGRIDYRVFSQQNTRVGIAGAPKTPVERVTVPGGYKYCFTVPSGFWVMRRGGNVVMTGNCGMVASLTSLTANDLPDNLSIMRGVIEGHVPHGFTKGGRDKGSWGEAPDFAFDAYLERETCLQERLAVIVSKHPKIVKAANRSISQLGTLGTGNHFIELCLDGENRVWVVLHSGSRGIGNAIGRYFIELAREDMRRYWINLPDIDLAYLPEGTKHHDDYIEAVLWAQNYAAKNRELMLQQVLLAMRKVLGRPFDSDVIAVNCHHNYVAKENHLGQNLWVTRKGAVRARQGDLGIIPGSMGARSYIVRGLGNDESFHSCSHGAGRIMSRTEAKRQITVEQHILATEGIECRKDINVIDESPAAYKNIDLVMAAQSDLVEVLYELHQILNVKG